MVNDEILLSDRGETIAGLRPGLVRRVLLPDGAVMNAGVRPVLITITCVSLLAAGAMLFKPQWPWLAWIVIACGLICLTLLLRVEQPGDEREGSEPESIDRLAEGKEEHNVHVSGRYGFRDNRWGNGYIRIPSMPVDLLNKAPLWSTIFWPGMLRRS